MSEEYSFKRLNASRLKDLHFLFEESNKKVEFDDLLKKYNTSKFGNQFIGYVAYDTNKNIPIAFYGVLPLLAKYNKDTIAIAQSADTLTHPEYRKKGLFVALAKRTYALCEEEKIDYLFGIPNYNSFGGFVAKLEWTHHGNFKIYVKNILTLPINKLSQKNKLIGKIYPKIIRKWVNFLGFSIKTELSHPIEKTFFRIPKNKEYLSYKLTKWHFILQYKGLEILVSFNRFLKIGYFSEANHPYGEKAIQKLVLLAYLTGCHKIMFQELESENEFDNYFSGFKTKKGLPFITKTIGSKQKEEELHIDYCDFDTF